MEQSRANSTVRGIFVNISKNIKRALIGNVGRAIPLIGFYLVFTTDISILAIQLLIGSFIQDIINSGVFRQH